jgi:hypothetical protein
MFIINNKTNQTLGPYNGLSISANQSTSISGSASPYIADGVLLSDIIDGKCTITFAGKESDSISGAALLLQLGQLFNTDSDGASLSRVKQAPSGWTYQMRSIEFESSNLTGLYNKDISLNDVGDATTKFYDVNGTLITDQTTADSQCVKDVIDIEPPYDYYLIGGTIRLSTTPTSDVRLSVVGVPDYPAPIGSKVLVQNLNLKYLVSDGTVEVDGRASKGLLYNNPVPHTNKIRFIITHPAGEKHQFMISLEMYKV